MYKLRRFYKRINIKSKEKFSPSPFYQGLFGGKCVGEKSCKECGEKALREERRGIQAHGSMFVCTSTYTASSEQKVRLLWRSKSCFLLSQILFSTCITSLEGTQHLVSCFWIAQMWNEGWTVAPRNQMRTSLKLWLYLEMLAVIGVALCGDWWGENSNTPRLEKTNQGVSVREITSTLLTPSSWTCHSPDVHKTNSNWV